MNRGPAPGRILPAHAVGTAAPQQVKAVAAQVLQDYGRVLVGLSAASWIWSGFFLLEKITSLSNRANYRGLTGAECLQPGVPRSQTGIAPRMAANQFCAGLQGDFQPASWPAMAQPRDPEPPSPPWRRTRPTRPCSGPFHRNLSNFQVRMTAGPNHLAFQQRDRPIRRKSPCGGDNRPGFDLSAGLLCLIRRPITRLRTQLHSDPLLPEDWHQAVPGLRAAPVDRRVQPASRAEFSCVDVASRNRSQASIERSGGHPTTGAEATRWFHAGGAHGIRHSRCRPHRPDRGVQSRLRAVARTGHCSDMLVDLSNASPGR